MPQALPEIQGVDNTQNWLAATRAGITDRQLQQNYDIQNQNRLMRQNVGNALAGENPDMPDSQKQALQGGDFDLYGQLHGWAQKASDEEHANIAKAHEVTANLLDVIAKEPDPIKQQQYWEQAKQTAIQLGMPQDEIGKLDQMTKQFGISGALNFEAARVGKQADIIQAAQAQRQQAYKDIGQVAAQYQGDPDRWLAEGVPALKQAGYNVDDIASPAGLQIAIGRAGLGGQVMGNEAKEAAAAAKAKTTPDYIENIPGAVTGTDFITEAKKRGVSSQDLDEAGRVASYDTDINKLYGIKSDRRAYIDRLAARINPGYKPENYKAAADSTSKLASGDVAKAVRSIGRLFDETEQASSLVDQANNSDYETVNRAAGATYPSGSQYQQAQGKLGTALNNVFDTASAVAKGGGQGAEGDVKRRAETMNRYQAPATLKGALATEAEVGLKNGQSNLTSYNTAHGYTPDDPNYKSIMDYLTPAQQKKAIAMLGADKIAEITGKPVATGAGALQPGKVYKWNPATNRVEE